MSFGIEDVVGMLTVRNGVSLKMKVSILTDTTMYIRLGWIQQSTQGREAADMVSSVRSSLFHYL
jgi:hypothetical protein